MPSKTASSTTATSTTRSRLMTKRYPVRFRARAGRRRNHYQSRGSPPVRTVPGTMNQHHARCPPATANAGIPGMVNRRTLLLGTAATAATMLLGACGGAPGKPSAENTPPVRTGYLDVPGARLYYETRGSGKPLLMIHGGAVDA